MSYYLHTIMSKLRNILLLLTALPFLLSAQAIPDSIAAPTLYSRHLVSTPVPPVGNDSVRLGKKSFWRASAETVGFNIGLWAFDRYVQKGHYAYISLNTIKENFKHGFEWDNDHLSTNMFAHPYNGSLFYNAGRSNGYNFWQSELFAIGGSAMWRSALPYFRSRARRPLGRRGTLWTRIGGIHHISHAWLHTHHNRTGLGKTFHSGTAFRCTAHQRVTVARLPNAGVPRR